MEAGKMWVAGCRWKGKDVVGVWKDLTCCACAAGCVDNLLLAYNGIDLIVQDFRIQDLDWPVVTVGPSTLAGFIALPTVVSSDHGRADGSRHLILFSSHGAAG